MAHCLRPKAPKTLLSLSFFSYLCLVDRTDMSVSDSPTLTTARDSRAQENLLSFYLIFGALSLSLLLCCFTGGFDTFTNNSTCCSWYGVPVNDACKPCCQVNPLVGLLPLAVLLRIPDVQLCRFTCHSCVFLVCIRPGCV